MTALLILGAAVWAKGPSPTLLRRTLHAVTVWEQGIADHIIPCGGLGTHPPTEAAAMAQILRDRGVPADAITVEDASTSTYHNIRLALPILRARDTRDVIIVTDRYHARRAAMVARHFGLNVRTDSPQPAGTLWRGRLRPQLREWAAMPFYALRLWQSSLTRH